MKHLYKFASLYLIYVLFCLICLWLYYITVCSLLYLLLVVVSCRTVTSLFLALFRLFLASTDDCYIDKVRYLWRHLEDVDWSKQRTVRVRENCDWSRDHKRWLGPKPLSSVRSGSTNPTQHTRFRGKRRQHGRSRE